MDNTRFKITITDTENTDEVKRTLSTLFSVRAGSQPTDRDFGISWECLDEIPEVAESLFYLEAVNKVEKYEPRVEVSDIEYAHAGGIMTAHIYFKRKGG